VNLQAQAVAFAPVVVRGLESAHSHDGAMRGTRVLHAGRFPLPGELPQGDRISELERSLNEGQEPPELRPRDWYFTLGLDIASLARAALREVPETAVTQKEEVRRRHKLARDALLLAKGDLISTSASGFSSSHQIQREISVQGEEEESP
jgi:hypothetical protein